MTEWILFTSFDFWKILSVKALFAAILGKNVKRSVKVNEPAMLYLLFYVHCREIPEKKVAGVACKQSRFYHQL